MSAFDDAFPLPADEQPQSSASTFNQARSSRVQPTPSVTAFGSLIDVFDGPISSTFEKSYGTTLPSSSPASRPPAPVNSLNMHTTSNPFLQRSMTGTHFVGQTELTPVRAHYLKKTLVNMVFMNEISVISDPALGSDGIASLGAPFKPPMVGGGDTGRPLQPKPLPDLPFLRFMFRQFILTFPFLSAAPANFFPDKLQPFLSQFLSLSLNESSIPFSKLSGEPEAEDADFVKRRRIFEKLEKHMTLLLGNAIKLLGGEEVVRIGQEDLRKLEDEARRKVEGMKVKEGDQEEFFEINVIGVRNVSEKGRVRSRSHEEFLVRTRRSGQNDIHVWRRYGDFKRLSEEVSILQNFPHISN